MVESPWVLPVPEPDTLVVGSATEVDDESDENEARDE